MAIAIPPAQKPAGNGCCLKSQPLSGRRPFFTALPFLAKNYFFLFNGLKSMPSISEKLKGRLLIIIKRPLASLTDC